MSDRHLAVFLGVSLLLHLLLLLLIFSGLLAHLRFEPAPPDAPRTVTLTLIPAHPPPPPPPDQDPERLFVDTAGLRQVQETNPQTPFESEHTTRATTQMPGQPDSILPAQTGEDRSGLEFFDSEYTPESPTEPSAAAQPQQASPAADARPEQEAVEQPQERMVPPAPRLHSDGTRTAAREPREKQEQQERRDPSQPVTEQEKSEREQTPMAFSAHRRATNIEGGGAQADETSIAARESTMGRYRSRLRRAIGSRWYAYVQDDASRIGLGTVRLRFYIRSDGVITDVQVVEGPNYSQLLAVSRRSVMEVSGQLESFPESMRVQVGDGYYEEISFTIY